MPFLKCYFMEVLTGSLLLPSLPPRVIAFSLDTEQPDYDLDSEDEAFVNKLKKKMEITALQFEEMIDRLEKGSGQQVLGPASLRRRAVLTPLGQSLHTNTHCLANSQWPFGMLVNDESEFSVLQMTIHNMVSHSC